jgi:GNAT superfamily N-acetyltransferase
MMDHHRRLDPRFATAVDGPQAYEGYIRKCLRSRSYGVFVAEAGEQVTGYTVVTILENQRVFALARFGFVAELCVAESMRRKGVGRDLWEAAVRWCREKGVTVVQMNVSALNDAARGFWRSVGCREYLEVLWHDIGGEESGERGKAPGRDSLDDEEF